MTTATTTTVPSWVPTVLVALVALAVGIFGADILKLVLGIAGHIFKFVADNWGVFVAFFAGAFGWAAIKAVVEKAAAWTAARATAAVTDVEADTAKLEALIDAHIKSALTSIQAKL